MKFKKFQKMYELRSKSNCTDYVASPSGALAPGNLECVYEKYRAVHEKSNPTCIYHNEKFGKIGKLMYRVFQEKR